MNQYTARRYASGIRELTRKRGVAETFRFWSDYGKLKRDLARKLAPIAARHRIDSPGVSYQKYLEIDYWLFENLRRVFVLGLDRHPRKLKILDIGCGAAYFLYACRYYGHEVEGLDVPDNEMYNEIVAALGIKRYSKYITKFEDLPTAERYDLITAFMICFNCHNTPEVWYIKEWESFLASLHDRNLNADAEVVLSFNCERNGDPINPELLAYFLSRNATIEVPKIHMKSNCRFRD
jgi:SAM-dependent methyltransferase